MAEPDRMMSLRTSFEWDEAKRLSNLRKHGLDFIFAERMFDRPHLIEPADEIGDEQRFLVIAKHEMLCDGSIHDPRRRHPLDLVPEGAQ